MTEENSASPQERPRQDTGTAGTVPSNVETDRIDDRYPSSLDVTSSPVARSVSRTVTPFVIAFGAYLTLFGTNLPGGAFQGGVVMATLVVLIALAFGFDPTRAWIDERAFAGLFLLGAGIFGVVAFGALYYGGAVLEVGVFPTSIENMVKLVEVAIAALVSGVVIGLYIWTYAGFQGSDTKT